MAYKKSRDELEKDLESQLEFLKRSADAYNNGYKGEATRLAGPLAILLHDDARSQGVSLLNNWGKRTKISLILLCPIIQKTK